MFEYFDGVTDEIWLDNSTSLINHSDRALPVVSPAFQNFCDYYNVSANPVAPAEPTYKGLVENAVGQAQREILRPISKRPFFDLKSLNIELAIKLKELNDCPMTTHSKSSRHERYLNLEQNLLKPLPRLPYSPDMKVIRRKVLKGDQFRLGDIRYNVPWGHSGQYLSIFVDSGQRLLRCFSTETGEFLFDTQIRNPGSGDEPMRPEFVVPELRYLVLTRQQLVEEISELGLAAALLAQHLARQSNSRACTH